MKTTKYISKTPDSFNLIHWTQDENQTWNKLISRQNLLTKNYACDLFLNGLERIEFSSQRVPQHTEINKKLKDFTGWEVEIVPALIPAKDFFTLLANKKFPAASFIRIPEELDYIEEPDIFHEFYGHVPLLTFPEYAKFMQEFGRFALSLEPNERRRVFRLFWFSIEFGLIRENGNLKAYGGGILSSIKETAYCLDSSIPERSNFDPLTVLRTPYRIDIPQPLYYVIDQFDDLFRIMDLDLKQLLKESKELGDLPPLFSMDPLSAEL